MNSLNNYALRLGQQTVNGQDGYEIIFLTESVSILLFNIVPFKFVALYVP